MKRRRPAINISPEEGDKCESNKEGNSRKGGGWILRLEFNFSQNGSSVGSSSQRISSNAPFSPDLGSSGSSHPQKKGMSQSKDVSFP